MSNTGSGIHIDSRDDIEIDSGSAHSIERSQQPQRQGITLSSFETVVRGRTEDHQVISTGNYYQTESRGFDNCADEGQEWEGDGESGEL